MVDGLQASEIAAARWMPVDEFLALPYQQAPAFPTPTSSVCLLGVYYSCTTHVQPGNLHAELYRTAIADARGGGMGFGRERLPLAFRRGEGTVYRPTATRSRL